MSQQASPFDATLTEVQAAAKLSNLNLALFHFHNPNGLCAKWAKLGDRLVALGRGYAAYGDTGFYYNELRRLASSKRVNTISLQSVLNGIRRTIEKASAFLAENEPKAVVERKIEPLPITVEKDDLAFPGERVVVAYFRLYAEADVVARALSKSGTHNLYVTDTRCGGAVHTYSGGFSVAQRPLKEID